MPPRRRFPPYGRAVLSFARLIPRFERAAPPTPGPAAPDDARAGGETDIERLIGQLEDDMRFTMNVIAREADLARAKIDESVEQANRIHDASEALNAVTVRAKGVNAALTHSAERLDASAHSIRSRIEGVDAFTEEASLLTGEVSQSMERLAESVSRIDLVAHLIAMIAKQTKILSLNAGIEAARAGPEGRGFAVVAQEINALAAKAQTATADIARHVDELHSVSDASGASARRISSLINRLGPVAQSVKDSIEQQLEESGKAAARAVDSAAFIETVAHKAKEVRSLADASNLASKAAKQASDGVVLAMARYTQRSTVYIRNSVSGDRRRHERVPVKIPGALVRGGDRMSVTALDISEGGALLLIDGNLAPAEDRLVLSLVSVGDCVGQVIAVSELGSHFRFVRPSDAVKARIRALMAAIKRDDMPFITAVQEGAAAIQRAFDEGVESGETSADALITNDYRPIAGTDPTQYETPGLHFYERILPPITKPYWEASPAPVFAFATDRNAYLPVHHEKYSLPQRPGQWDWNDLYARNKRIMERWQSLVLSRNREPNFVKVFLRHMESGAMRPIKAFCAPIWVDGRLWGNFTMGYYY